MPDLPALQKVTRGLVGSNCVIARSKPKEKKCIVVQEFGIIEKDGVDGLRELPNVTTLDWVTLHESLHAAAQQAIVEDQSGRQLKQSSERMFRAAGGRQVR